MWSSCRSSGVVARRGLRHERPDASDLGLRPVPTTTAIPEPSATTVAAKTMLSRSGSGASAPQMSAAIFVDRHALAGQGRLIDAQVIGLDDARVGRDRVTGLEEQDVARHQLVSRDHHLAPVPAYERRR